MEVLNKPVLMTEFGKWPYWGIVYREKMHSQIYADTFAAEMGTWLSDMQGDEYSFSSTPGADYGPISVGTAFWDLVPIDVCSTAGACSLDAKYSIYPFDDLHAGTIDIILAHSSDLSFLPTLPGQSVEDNELALPPPPPYMEKYETLVIGEVVALDDGQLGEEFKAHEFKSSWNIWTQPIDALLVYMDAWAGLTMQSISPITAADHAPEGFVMNSPIYLKMEMFFRWTKANNLLGVMSMLTSLGISISPGLQDGETATSVAEDLLDFSLLPEDFLDKEDFWIRVLIDLGPSVSKIYILNFSSDVFSFDLDDVKLLTVMEVLQNSAPPPLSPPPPSPPPPSPPPPPPPPSPPPPPPPPPPPLVPTWVINEAEEGLDLEKHWSIQICQAQPGCQLVSASALASDTPIILEEDFDPTTAYESLPKGVSLILPEDGLPILVLVGTDSCDCIVGADGFINYVLAGDGSDTIILGSKGNLVYGGGGDDIIIGGSSNDKIFGQAGGDIILSNGGNDLVFGGTGLVDLRFLSFK